MFGKVLNRFISTSFIVAFQLSSKFICGEIYHLAIRKYTNQLILTNWIEFGIDIGETMLKLA